MTMVPMVTEWWIGSWTKQWTEWLAIGQIVDSTVNPMVDLMVD